MVFLSIFKNNFVLELKKQYGIIQYNLIKNKSNKSHVFPHTEK